MSVAFRGVISFLILVPVVAQSKYGKFMAPPVVRSPSQTQVRSPAIAGNTGATGPFLNLRTEIEIEKLEEENFAMRADLKHLSEQVQRIEQLSWQEQARAEGKADGPTFSSMAFGLGALGLGSVAAYSFFKSSATNGRRVATVTMALTKKPGEGDPFSEEAKAAAPVPAYQPRTINMPLSSDVIELEDEPWLADCRAKTGLARTEFEKAYTSELPYVQAEENLEDELVKCQDEESIDSAIKACLNKGGRQGCPAIVTAEKLKADMAKAKEEGKPVPKAKPRKVAVGGDKPGFSAYGENRKLAVTHDNSI